MASASAPTRHVPRTVRTIFTPGSLSCKTDANLSGSASTLPFLDVTTAWALRRTSSRRIVDWNPSRRDRVTINAITPRPTLTREMSETVAT